MEKCDLCEGIPEKKRSAVVILKWWGGKEIRAQICQYCAIRLEQYIKGMEAHANTKVATRHT